MTAWMIRAWSLNLVYILSYLLAILSVIVYLIPVDMKDAYTTQKRGDGSMLWCKAPWRSKGEKKCLTLITSTFNWWFYSSTFHVGLSPLSNVTRRGRLPHAWRGLQSERLSLTRLYPSSEIYFLRFLVTWCVFLSRSKEEPNKIRDQRPWEIIARKVFQNLLIILRAYFYNDYHFRMDTLRPPEEITKIC